MLTSLCKYSSHFNRTPLDTLPHLLKCQLLVSKCRYSIQVKDTFGPSSHDPNTNNNKNNSTESRKKSFCAINFKVNTFPQSRAKDITSILFDLRRAAKRNNDNAGETLNKKSKEKKRSPNGKEKLNQQK